MRLGYRFWFGLLFCCLVMWGMSNSFLWASERVSVHGDWVLVDGKYFFVKAIGYEVGSRPGQMPWKTAINKKIIRLDFERIKAAGFNTLRTWNPYPDEVLTLAKEYGFMVIQGYYVDFRTFFSNDKVVGEAIANVKEMVRRSQQFDNILMYLVMNEPHPDVLEAAGIPKVIHLMGKLKSAVKEVDPTALVSFSNCAMADFLPMDLWDVTCFNVYPYGPNSVKMGIGFADYLKWLKKTYAKDKPFIVTEFGLSVSPKGEGKWGYGGNSLKEQADGDVWMYEKILESGATGAAVFSWIDGWWKNYEKQGDEKTHDPDPEEWFGLLGIPDDQSPLSGIIRPAYNALKKFMTTIDPQKITFNWLPEIAIKLVKGNIEKDSISITLFFEANKALSGKTVDVILYKYNNSKTYRHSVLLDANGKAKLKIAPYFVKGYYAVSVGVNKENGDRIGNFLVFEM